LKRGFIRSVFMKSTARSVFRGGRCTGRVLGEKLSLTIGGLLAGLVLVGCGGGGGVPGETGIRLLEVDSPLKSPVWGSSQQAVFALQQDEDRLVKVEVADLGYGSEGSEDSGDGGTADGARLAPTLTAGLDEGIGENFAADLPGDGVLYVPQPALDQVAVVEDNSMGVIRTHDVGPAPEQVTADARAGAPAGNNVLFTLSADNSTITGTNLASGEIVFQEDVEASDDTLIEAARTGANAELWTAGPEGVSYYSVGGLRQPVELDRSTTALTVQPGDATRAFVGDAGGEVTAVRATSSLALRAGEQTTVDGRVETLAAEEDNLYAATPGRLVVLDPESLEQERAIEFAEVRQGFSGAVPSGIAIGERSIYVTLQGQPYMLKIEKP
jgi:hypothetical protein